MATEPTGGFSLGTILTSIGLSTAFAAGAAWATISILAKTNSKRIADMEQKLTDAVQHGRKEHEEMLQMIRNNSNTAERLGAQVSDLAKELHEFNDDQKFERRLARTADVQMKVFLKAIESSGLQVVKR